MFKTNLQSHIQVPVTQLASKKQSFSWQSWKSFNPYSWCKSLWYSSAPYPFSPLPSSWLPWVSVITGVLRLTGPWEPGIIRSNLSSSKPFDVTCSWEMFVPTAWDLAFWDCERRFLFRSCVTLFALSNLESEEAAFKLKWRFWVEEIKWTSILFLCDSQSGSGLQKGPQKKSPKWQQRHKASCT